MQATISLYLHTYINPSLPIIFDICYDKSFAQLKSCTKSARDYWMESLSFKWKKERQIDR